MQTASLQAAYDSAGSSDGSRAADGPFGGRGQGDDSIFKMSEDSENSNHLRLEKKGSRMRIGS